MVVSHPFPGAQQIPAMFLFTAGRFVKTRAEDEIPDRPPARTQINPDQRLFLSGLSENRRFTRAFGSSADPYQSMLFLSGGKLDDTVFDIL